MEEKPNNNISYFKILVPTLLTVILFVLAFFLVLIPGYKKNIIAGKEEMLKQLSMTAWSIMDDYHKASEAGLISEEMAKREAVDRIEHLRYGPENKDYFWITDTVPIMIMHPYRSDLDGTNVSDFEDRSGKKLFTEFVTIVKENGEGFTNYFWQWKDDPREIELKRSFVKEFKPWGWIIGTGIYFSDVDKSILKMTQRFIWIALSITLLVVILLSIMIIQNIALEKQRIKAVNKLKVSEKNLKDLNNTKDKLFSIIAHDLRTPFSTIMGFSEILARNPDSMQNKDKEVIFKHLNDQIKRTLTMLDNLLNWAKAQTGQLKNIPEPINLTDLIWDTLFDLNLTAEKKNITLKFDPGTETLVKADPDLLKVVIRNLLTNAIKFSHPGGTVTAEVIPGEGSATINIADCGTGIRKEELEYLFIPGAAESKTGTAKEKGTGLGLLICKEFVEKMGGTIQVESEYGKGSVFKIVLRG